MEKPVLAHSLTAYCRDRGDHRDSRDCRDRRDRRECRDRRDHIDCRDPDNLAHLRACKLVFNSDWKKFKNRVESALEVLAPPVTGWGDQTELGDKLCFIVEQD